MRRTLFAALASMIALLGMGLAVPGSALAAAPYPPLTSCYGEQMDIGVADPCVGAVQQALNALGIPDQPLRVDSIYGAQTKAAVISFQQRHNLTDDGITGRQTVSALADAATNSPPVTPQAATPSTPDCPGGGRSFVSSGSATVELALGENHPNVSNQNDSITITESQGRSGTWATSSSTSANVQIGEDPAKFGLSASTDSSSSVTLTLTRSETDNFMVPPHTTMRVDYMAALGITQQGNNCKVDRTEVKVLGTGYRITTVDEASGKEQQKFNWPGMTNNAVPTF